MTSECTLKDATSHLIQTMPILGYGLSWEKRIADCSSLVLAAYKAQYLMLVFLSHTHTVIKNAPQICTNVVWTKLARH